MRFVIQLFLALIIGIIAVFAVANREGTKVDFSPFPFTAELPLYMIILGGISVGLIIGVSLSSFSRFRLSIESKKHRKRLEELELSAEKRTSSNPTPHITKLQTGHRLTLTED